MSNGAWRVGRKTGRTLYIQVGDEPSWDDKLVGMVDTPELARVICAAMNRWLGYAQIFHGEEVEVLVDPLNSCGTVMPVDSDHRSDAVPQHDRAVPSVPPDADLPVVELNALGDQPGPADA